MSTQEVAQLSARLNALELTVVELKTTLRIAGLGLAFLATVVAPIITAFILMQMGIK